MNARLLHAVAHLLAIAAALSVTTAIPESARAGPILSRGDVHIKASASADQVNGTLVQDGRELTLPSGDPTSIEAFVKPSEAGWFAFTRGTPTTLSTAFSSALINGAGFAGVGVSGTLDPPANLTFGVLEAGAEFSQVVTNLGGAGPISLTYSIPLIEIATSGNRFSGNVGAVSAAMFATRFNINGDFVEQQVLFDYQLVFRDLFGQTFKASADLLNDSAGLVDLATDCLLANCVAGKKVLPFTATKTIRNVDPGDWIDFRYFMNTDIVAGREGGGHALYGDPFELSAGPGSEFLTFSVEGIAVDPAQSGVPEPGTLLLVLAGLVGLGVLGCRTLRAKATSDMCLAMTQRLDHGRNRAHRSTSSRALSSCSVDSGEAAGSVLRACCHAGTRIFGRTTSLDHRTSLRQAEYSEPPNYTRRANALWSLGLLYAFRGSV